MDTEILIPQDILTFKESNRDKWYKELGKKVPFENDYNIISSKVPLYNRQKTIDKAIIRPKRYFRECCAINAYSTKFKKHIILIQFTYFMQKNGLIKFLQSKNFKKNYTMIFIT